MTVRLTKCLRDNINHRIREYAFAERRKAVAHEKPALFRRAMTDIHGADVLARIRKLPAHWFDFQSHVSLNLDGWSYNLSVSDEKVMMLVPARAPDGKCHSGAAVLKDAALVAAIRDHATREDALRSEEKKMRYTLMSLLAGCATVEIFLRAMPDAKEWIGEIAAVPTASNALVVSGTEIARLVRTARAKETVS